MPVSPRAILLALTLLAVPVLAQPGPASCPVGVLHVGLPEVLTDELPQVCISPGLGTLFSFDAALGTVKLDAAERFTQVEFGQSTLKLMPSEQVQPGDQLRLTVRFKDNAAPSSATFLLTVHAAQAVPLVDVHRQPRTVESYREELKAKEGEVRQCLEENAQLRFENAGPGGIAGLLTSRLMGEQGIASQDIVRNTGLHPLSGLFVVMATSYRATGRVAVAVKLRNSEGAALWTAEGATLHLEGKRGVALNVLRVWQEAPIDSGKWPRLLVVEAAAKEQEAKGSFTLTLWEAGGARTLTLGGVTFP
ncbi:DUF2381 family protein [Stigmatella sp. ncwal1]|uniref:DUF2381 family protein n=1 Tax=Stigmatella ashevillensis TaxID=2995309 RepID=A0ABT5DI63_9BACT|nr:DUF2381 family protein [Stigmatella ashevillena]MDC0713211.1 DUF2381 family protein [Stigmatella ashevillena]